VEQISPAAKNRRAANFAECDVHIFRWLAMITISKSSVSAIVLQSSNVHFTI
jgi:hypothetical protein